MKHTRSIANFLLNMWLLLIFLPICSPYRASLRVTSDTTNAPTPLANTGAPTLPPLSIVKPTAAPSTILPTPPPATWTPYFSPNETEHVLSVSVRIHAAPNAQIYYTLDGSTPSRQNGELLDSSQDSSDSIVYIDTIGTTFIKAIATLTGYADSDVAVKKYEIIDRCAKPTFFPSGGTFAGHQSITLSSATPGSVINYELSSPDGKVLSGAVDSGGTISISSDGTSVLSAWASKPGSADSATQEATYTILPKVATPTILPDNDFFTISATLTFDCSTPNSTIFITTDGSEPTETSLSVKHGASIVFEEAGLHTVKAFATEVSQLHSDTVTKVFTILSRASAPILLPPAATDYVGDVSLTFQCPKSSSSSNDDSPEGGEGIIYYTLTETNTPSTSSPQVPCGGNVLLKAPGKYLVRAFRALSGDSPSSIIQALYVLVRPPYDTFPVISAPFQVQPDVEVLVVEKNLRALNGYRCDSRNIRGRLVALHNPIGHFDLVEPAHGCGKGLTLPSISGRSFKPPSAGWVVDASPASTATPQERVRSRLMKEMLGGAAGLSAINVHTVEQWQSEFRDAQGLGCQVVTNAGFFNVTSTACFGDLVTEGTIIQTSKKHNVNFGIRNGSFVVGYVEEEEIKDPTRPFDTLISGLTWLVRGGQSYVTESLSPFGDNEDMSAQSTGTQFAHVVSARTALGHDHQGRLLILQVEGETWVRGMTLYEFADFAAELGFYNAINLDGGGSATMTVNHSLISEPSWKCTDASNTNGYFYCEKAVSTVTCIHAMSPPVIPWLHGRIPLPSLSSPSLSPSSTGAAPTSSTPDRLPPPSPTPFPSYSWEGNNRPSNKPSYWHDDFMYPPSHPSPSAPSSAGFDAGGNANSTLSSANVIVLQKSLLFYQISTYILSFLLCVSIFVHGMSFVKDKGSVGPALPMQVGTNGDFRSEGGIHKHNMSGNQYPHPPSSSSSSSSLPPPNVGQPPRKVGLKDMFDKTKAFMLPTAAMGKYITSTTTLIQTHTYPYIYTYTFIHTHLSIYIYTYTYTDTYIYIYMIYTYLHSTCRHPTTFPRKQSGLAKQIEKHAIFHRK